MAAIDGDVYWGFQPVGDGTNMKGSFFDFRQNYLKSANDPLRYQIQWKKTGYDEATPATATGDLVNVVFKVYTYVDSTYKELIATIKKSKDIANKKYTDNSVAPLQRFTIDVSQLVSDQLSYSLCPINKGTWQSSNYGGMNGGLTMQDNLLGNTTQVGDVVSNYNVSKNGTFRRLQVEASFEVLDSSGKIVVATDSPETSTVLTIINSVNQFEKDILYYFQTFNMDDDNYTTYRFLSRCPNFINDTTHSIYKKPVRLEDEAEFLQFYLRSTYSYQIRNDGSADSRVGNIGLYIETFLSDGTAENDFYIRDFEDNITTFVENDFTTYNEYQNRNFIQNISPYYINNTASLKAGKVSPTTITAGSNYPYWSAYSGNKITSSTAFYRVSVSKFAMFTQTGGGYNERRQSQYYYYSIDRESVKIPYGFVRFHWLNSMGGTDSYTAKRDIVEGLTIGRDVIERKSGDRTWYQGNKDSAGSGVADTSYHSDTMRGGDIYKGGREVTNVNAERTQSVYTEPLNKDVAKWLEEIMLSPNVWIEMDTDATEMGNDRNPYLRPSDKEYIPVIITNSDIETVNQENGLVKFNIEYTLAHKVITQRN